MDKRVGTIKALLKRIDKLGIVKDLSTMKKIVKKYKLNLFDDIVLMETGKENCYEIRMYKFNKV